MLNDKFYVSDKLEERTVELGDGTTEVLHFRHLSNVDFERYALWTNSADEDVLARAHSRLLVLGLSDPDGKPAVTIEQAERIKRPIMQRLITHLLEVNGYGKAAPKAEAGNG